MQIALSGVRGRMGAGLWETWVAGGLVGRGDLETGQQKDLKTAKGEMIFRSKPWRREEGIISLGNKWSTSCFGI